MATCPRCGHEAYVGIFRVECAAVGCDNFSREYAEEVWNRRARATTDSFDDAIAPHHRPRDREKAILEAWARVFKRGVAA